MVIKMQKSTISISNLRGEEVQYLVSRLPFQVGDLDMGLKYLGFQLNPNSYLKGDWMWLLVKIEKRIRGWSHRWLSRARRFVLIKSVLEAIPVY